MNGRESLWGWLGVGLALQVVAGVLIGIATTEDVGPGYAIAGYAVAGLGGVVALICIIGIGVTAGMLRYDHLRKR